MGYLFVAATVLLTVYGQLVLKWQVGMVGSVPDGIAGKLGFLLGILPNPWVISALVAAFAAAMFWMLALSKLPLTTAYPFTASSFLLVLFFGAAFFGEAITLGKLLGTLLVFAGIAIMSMKG
jgi:multidrug transporter EmrE-like cation transporter